jgi:hypothetical protein
MTPPAEPQPDALARARDAAVALFAAGAAVVLFVQFRAYVYEDAYITYRYADNLARGLGFVFNPGERVLGTSTPLFALVLAALATLGADVPAAGAALYAGGLAAAALGGAWVLRRYGHGNLGAVYAVAVLWGIGNGYKYFGMETTFYAALLLATVIAALRGRAVATGILLALAFLTRYDAFMLTAALFVTLWIAHREIPWRTYLAAAVVVAPWLVFAFLYFGSVMPNTLAAKTREVMPLEYMAGSLERIAGGLVEPLDPVLPRSPLFPWAAAVGLAAPLLVRTVRWARRDVHLVLFLAFPVLLWLGYALIGPPLAHDWYFLPATLFFVLGGLLAWGEILGRLVRGRWPALLALALVAASALALPGAVAAERQRMMGSVVYLRRAEAYELLARFILRHGLQDLRLVTFEPGYLTYVTKSPVIDAVGLVSKDVPREGSSGERLQQIVDERHPDLILASSVVVGRLEGPYVPLYHSATKSLYVASGVLAERIDALAWSWVRGTFGEAPGPGALRHPLRVDFDVLTDDWIATSSREAAVGRPRALSFRGEKTAGSYLHTSGSRGAGIVASPPVVLDFDVLSFLVNAPSRTKVELLVDGQAVLAFDGRDGMGEEMEEVVWPVHSWRERTAMLRLFDAAHGYLALDRLASRRFARPLPLDDFETDPARFGELWAQGFGDRPCHFLVLAPRYGLAAVLGKATAASLCRHGVRELVSRPFTVERDRLAMTVLDYGGRRTRVELRDGGEVTHRFTGGDVRRPVGLVWDVSGLRGRRVVLAAVDDDRRLRQGIGVDDVVLFDWED